MTSIQAVLQTASREWEYMVAALMRLTLQWGNEKYFYCDECYEEKPGEGFREQLGISLTPLFPHV